MTVHLAPGAVSAPAGLFVQVLNFGQVGFEFLDAVGAAGVR